MYIAGLIACVTACSADVEPESYVADAEDATERLDASRDTRVDTTDARREDTTDAADADAETAPGCEIVRVELDDGEIFDAQLISTYDHRLWWWDVEDRTTLAFFEAAAYAAYPDGGSFRFEALADIESMEGTSAGSGDECYLDFVQRRAFTVDRSPLDGASLILMGNSGYHRYEGGYGDFAWDFSRVDETGSRYDGEGSTNADYLVWGETVYSPISGFVTDVVDEHPDNAPGDYPEDAKNNRVGIYLGGSFYLYLLHFQQGSIPDEIQPDTRVEVGDELGLVGNSGVSLEPHMHVALLWYDAGAERSWSVPTRFDELDVAPTPRGPWGTRTFYRPVTGDHVRDTEGF